MPFMSLIASNLPDGFSALLSRATPKFSPRHTTLLSQSFPYNCRVLFPSNSFNQQKALRKGNFTVFSASDKIEALPESPEKNKSRWLEKFASAAASLYPLYLVVGGVIACLKPSAYLWFVKGAPASYSFSLGFIMLTMGLTIRLQELVDVFLRQPFAMLFGCVAQYSIMPCCAALVSRMMGLSPEFSVGLILLGCCPGGTASNVVTLIAQGDVALSVVMTTCTTLCAVFCTPLLTKLLAGTFVPIDAEKLALSALEVVVAPVLAGSLLQTVCPRIVNGIKPFSPLFAVLSSSLLACSVFSANISLVKSSLSVSSGNFGTMSIFNKQLASVTFSVMALHAAGYILGYFLSLLSGLGEPQRRAISIEVGMQNSSLGVVLASTILVPL